MFIDSWAGEKSQGPRKRFHASLVPFLFQNDNAPQLYNTHKLGKEKQNSRDTSPAPSCDTHLKICPYRSISEAGISSV